MALQGSWINTVNTIAAASSSQLADLIKRLHQVAAQSRQSAAMDNSTADGCLRSAMQAVVHMPGVDGNELESSASLRSTVDSISSALKSPAAVPHIVLRTCVDQLVAWRQQVLMTLDGSGCKFSCNEVPEFQQGLPVRVLVDGRFVADCLDSNDLVKVFCCCPANSPLLQPDSIVSIARCVPGLIQDHRLSLLVSLSVFVTLVPLRCNSSCDSARIAPLDWQ